MNDLNFRFRPLRQCLTAAFFLTTMFATAQNVGINDDASTPASDAMLDVKSSDKGVLIPRMAIGNLATAAPVTSPTTGLLVYNTDGTTGPGFFYWDGTAWTAVGNDRGHWNLRGNDLSAADFLGSTNNQAVKFQMNGSEEMRIGTNGNLGIGTASPSEKIHVAGNARLDGALMPNNDAGTSGQVLMSRGAGNAPEWGQTILNPAATTAMGKYFVGPFNLPGLSYLTLTVADPNCVATSTCTITWINLPTGPNYGDVVTTVEAENGQWKFHMVNYTSSSLTNLQFSFFAFY